MSKAENGRVFRAAVCGFNPRDSHMLERIFELSKVRPRRYAPWQVQTGRPDLILVEADSVDGRKGHAALLARFDLAPIPTLHVGAAETPAPGAQIWFRKPLLALRLLQVMDNLVTEHYAYVPELDIKERSNPSQAHGHRWTAPCAETTRDGRPLCAGLPLLVVDDSTAIRDLMKANLVPCGFEVDYAETGEVAMRMIARKRYELIFLDVVLPGIQGFDVCRRIKQQLRIKTPVVLMTGRASRIDRVRGVLAAADHHVTKPLGHHSLLEVLHFYFPKGQPGWTPTRAT